VIAKIIRRLAVPILLAWMGLAAFTNTSVPPLEKVAEAHNVALSAKDAPSLKAMLHIGKVFNEFSSDNAAMIVIEGDQPLGAEAHAYYDALIDRLSADTRHVSHIQNFWGDPLTAAGSQSPDGKAAYTQIFLVGNQGEGQANESIAALRTIVDKSDPPPGVKAYVTGPPWSPTSSTSARRAPRRSR
jgi:RND superfamily putative drug exporter